MEGYTVDTLVKDVRIVLDRNATSAQLLSVGDMDTLTQDEIIKAKIVDAARIVEASAPLHLTGAGKSLAGSSVKYYPNGSMTYRADIALPSDMMRLQTVNMAGWQRPATIITEHDTLYAMQSCKWGGVRGNDERPVAAIVTRPGGLHLELYSVSKLQQDLSGCSYIPYPTVGANNTIALCEKLKPAVVYMAAYLACVTLGDNTTAPGLLATAQELAGMKQAETSETSTTTTE